MSDSTHYRRCHLCDTVNAVTGDLVTTCECCGKHLAPFYFFDESRAMGMTDSNFYSSLEDRGSSEVLPHKEYPPVWGLTVYWEP